MQFPAILADPAALPAWVPCLAQWWPGLLPVDVDLRREFVAAVAAAGLLFASLPRGRRRLAGWPWFLILLVPVPFLVALLFPGEAGAFPAAVTAARFLVLASLLQSALLVAAVSAWERIGRPLPRIFLDVLRWLVTAAALLAILYDSGVKAENLFTGSAVVTAALGFALKDTLGNVFAGLAIHAEHPFEVGDWIQYDANPAHIGRVVEINWRATKVLTLDEAFVIIPNGQLAQASIRNFTKPEAWSRRSLFVVTPYDVPPQRVQAIVLESLRGSFGVLEHPAPSVVTNAFTERGVEHWVRLFTTEFDKRDRVDGMARDRIWYALARHGIEIPVATHAVRLTQLPAPTAEPVSTSAERRIDALRRLDLFASAAPDELQRLAASAADRPARRTRHGRLFRRDVAADRPAPQRHRDHARGDAATRNRQGGPAWPVRGPPRTRRETRGRVAVPAGGAGRRDRRDRTGDGGAGSPAADP
jgi:small-conductance mechanosensitive channel